MSTLLNNTISDLSPYNDVTTQTVCPQTINNDHPDPQVKVRAARRRFTVADKLRIISEADKCIVHGQLGALLRREGIYSATLISFRKQQDEGKLSKDTAQVRKDKLTRDAVIESSNKRIASLELENLKLKTLLDIQKKFQYSSI